MAGRGFESRLGDPRYDRSIRETAARHAEPPVGSDTRRAPLFFWGGADSYGAHSTSRVAKAASSETVPASASRSGSLSWGLWLSQRPTKLAEHIHSSRMSAPTKLSVSMP